MEENGVASWYMKAKDDAEALEIAFATINKEGNLSGITLVCYKSKYDKRIVAKFAPDKDYLKNAVNGKRYKK